MTSQMLSRLSNPLASSSQLLKFQNRSDEEATSVRFAQAILTHSAGNLLRLPQQVTATALVLLQRHWITSSTSKHDPSTLSAAAIYTCAKISSTPLSPRTVINVYAYLTCQAASPLWFVNGGLDLPMQVDSTDYYISEGTYEREKIKVFAAETYFLYTIGFDTRVALPHALALTYLQAMAEAKPILAERVFEHLNVALLSPQLLYLTHQPNALAVAAIYLAAREVGIKLVQENWWEVFDVDREDLGFLVLAYGSLSNFAEAEKHKWNGRVIPLSK